MLLFELFEYTITNFDRNMLIFILILLFIFIIGAVAVFCICKKQKHSYFLAKQNE